MAKTVFENGNPALGVPGTVVTAEFLNATNNHRHTGKTEDGAGAIDYAADTGAANAYAIALTPALTEHITGMPICFKATNANTGASTLNVNGLGAVSIKRLDGSALQAGDIPAGAVICVVYDGTNYQLLTVPNIVTSQTGDVRYSLSATPRADEIKLNGASLSRTTYANLWAWAQANSVVVTEANWSTNTGAFSSGDGTTTFRVPEVRGEFPRFFDDSRGVDSGRVFGSRQEASYLRDYTGYDAYAGLRNPVVNADATASAGATNAAIISTIGPHSPNMTNYYFRVRNITFYGFIKF